MSPISRLASGRGTQDLSLRRSHLAASKAATHKGAARQFSQPASCIRTGLSEVGQSTKRLSLHLQMFLAPCPGKEKAACDCRQPQPFQANPAGSELDACRELKGLAVGRSICGDGSEA